MDQVTGVGAQWIVLLMSSGFDNFARAVRRTFRRPCAGRSSLKDKMLNKMRAEGIAVPGTNDEYELHRTRAGWAQRSAGAWSWFIIRRLEFVGDGPAPGELIGSCSPLSECVKKGAPIYVNRHNPYGWETDAPVEAKPIRVGCHG